jgi:hypothetical protein
MSPLQDYENRRRSWFERQARAQQQFITIGNLRLLTAIAAALLAWLIFGRGMFSAWSLMLPLIVFLCLVIWHQRVLHARRFADRALNFYDEGIARIKDQWIGTGGQGSEYKDATHPYAADLDLFGPGSLFQLLSRARTAAGEAALARWLLAPADFNEARMRQEGVRELAGWQNLREEIALLGEEIRSEIQVSSLARWGDAKPVAFPRFAQTSAFALAVAGCIALMLRLGEVWPLWPLLAVLALDFLLIFGIRKQVRSVVEAAESPGHNLQLLSLLVARLERETFSSGYLKRLKESLITNGKPASARISALNRWLELLDSSDHVLLRVLGPLLLYKQQLAMVIERWRTENGAAIARWIQALADFEALSSLAALHYERPAWIFPDLLDAASPTLSTRDLSHPLLPAAKAVGNDVELDSNCRLLIVSGSNMSGKSTLLRSIGLATVLAWTGAPVPAQSLRSTRLQVGASMRVTDSLQDNESRFFAEIKRLRQIVDLAQGPAAVLFLLDELLSGTNSHDRRIGAAGVLAGLLRANTIGAVTTHDLALTEPSSEIASITRNVHFEDRMLDGRMEFDFRLRPGVVAHSNALELMRSIGLNL